MNGLLDATRYSLSWDSLPGATAALVVVLVASYLIFVNGATLLRVALLLVALSLLPFVAAVALAGSTTSLETAAALYRIGISLVPLSGAGAMLFLLVLSGKAPRYRVAIIASLVVSGVIAPITIATDLIIDGAWMTPGGVLYFTVPSNGVAQLQASLIGGFVLVGVISAWRQSMRETSATRRRQLRGSSLAFSVCVFGLVDVPLGYQRGYYPMSWAFLTVGLLLALRMMIVHDLVHSRGLDRRAPVAVGYVLALALLVWTILSLVGTRSVLWTTVIIGTIFVLSRLVVGVFTTAKQSALSRHDSALDRTLERFGHSVQRLREPAKIGEATRDVIEIGVGCRSVVFLVPARDDYSWRELGGGLVDESATPDPLLLVWLEQNATPISRDDLATARLAGLRDSLERLYENHNAEMMVPLVNRDEVVGLIALGTLEGGRAYRPDELSFLARIQVHTASALVYARMHADATAQVELERDVGLAAALQSAFVPGSEVMVRGGVTLAGTYEPASKCGGDWWSAHELGPGRVLVLIGDVTGHGVAAAMVTAAAKGCYDVAQRLMRDNVDLSRLLSLLDAAVRRAGGSHFYMTCFATLIDTKAGIVRYANAGHVVPYVVRPSPTGKGMTLDVLVARGDPLGASENTSYTEHSREISKGDMLVWYTDGLVECVNRERKQFGDRRMQRILKRLEFADGVGRGAVARTRDTLVGAAALFREGDPADDDVTLVVGRLL